MKIFFAQGLIATLFVAGCSKSPYTITDRKEEGQTGRYVEIRATVPADATEEQMEDWCAEVRKREGKSKIVSLHFFEDGPANTYKAYCFAGRIHKRSGLMPPP